jgi:nucleoside 2-deoxyribosyltransferase
MISTAKTLDKFAKPGLEPTDNASSMLTVSIIGSYSKHLRQMREIIVECKKLSIQVLIPKYPVKKFSRNRFVYLKGENGTPRELQEKNFRFIEHSSFVLVVNPEGYIGPSTAMEIGFAIAQRIPVFSTEKPKDYVFYFYLDSGKSLAEIKQQLLDARITPAN